MLGDIVHLGHHVGNVHAHAAIGIALLCGERSGSHHIRNGTLREVGVHFHNVVIVGSAWHHIGVGVAVVGGRKESGVDFSHVALVFLRVAIQVVAHHIIEVHICGVPTQVHLAKSGFCHHASAHRAGFLHHHIETEVFGGHIKVVVVFCASHHDTVQAVDGHLAVDVEVSGIYTHTVLHAPETILIDGCLGVRLLQAHGDGRGGCGIHIVTVVEHLKLVSAHAQWRHFIEIVLGIVAINHHFPNTAMRFLYRASKHIRQVKVTETFSFLLPELPL